MPLSNALDSTTSLTARFSFAVFSMYGGHVARADAEGRLAARVGGPDHRVAAGGQDERDAGVVHQRVGRRRSTACSTHWMQCSGAPAATAASRTTRAAATDDSCALGWNAKTIGLRVLSAMSDLKIVVEVGLVTGVTPQMTPTGSAISVMPVSSSSRDDADGLEVRPSSW